MRGRQYHRGRFLLPDYSENRHRLGPAFPHRSAMAILHLIRLKLCCNSRPRSIRSKHKFAEQYRWLKHLRREMSDIATRLVQFLSTNQIAMFHTSLVLSSYYQEELSSNLRILKYFFSSCAHRDSHHIG